MSALKCFCGTLYAISVPFRLRNDGVTGNGIFATAGCAATVCGILVYLRLRRLYTSARQCPNKFGIALDFCIFGFALYTPARHCPNKFGIALAYS